jgi:hypothetical protein
MRLHVARPSGPELILRLVAAAGLAYTAYIHWDLRHTYAAIRTDTLSQGDLFAVQTVLCALAAAAVLIVGGLWSWLAAFAVAGGSLGAILLYRYVDVGQIGPIPNMYDPGWFPEKSHSAIASAVATGAALLWLGWLATRPRVPATGSRFPRRHAPRGT